MPAIDEQFLTKLAADLRTMAQEFNALRFGRLPRSYEGVPMPFNNMVVLAGSTFQPGTTAAKNLLAAGNAIDKNLTASSKELDFYGRGIQMFLSEAKNVEDLNKTSAEKFGSYVTSGPSTGPDSGNTPPNSTGNTPPNSNGNPPPDSSSNPPPNSDDPTEDESH